MKQFRIAWFSIVEDDSVLEGRSLVKANSQEEAIESLIAKISHEYRIKPFMINIQSIFEIQSNNNENEENSI